MPAQDDFKYNGPGLSSPISKIEVVTPNDATDLAMVTRAICVAESGLVEVVAKDGGEGAIYIAAGVPFPIRVSRIKATGTTATGIVGLS